jgi:hypothetical protein
MKKATRFTTTIAFSLVLLFSVSAYPKKKSADKIIFLYCTMANNTITLQKMEVVDGTLKSRRRNSSGDILYEIADIQNTIIEHGSMPAPDIEFRDYLDPVSREMKGTVSRCDTVSFVVRLPFNPNYRYASFYTVPGGNPSLTKSKMNLIGSFPIPAGNEK